jgi:hypothetical protein
MRKRHAGCTKVDTGRRRLAVVLLTAPIVAPYAGRAAEPPAIEVWTGPGCSCCHDWIEHLQANGFTVVAHDGGNSAAREHLGMPVRYGSCHTGEVEGYAIEGHVPAREILRLLQERPEAVGLSVPAMPRGSPGMDGPVYGNVRDPYDVLLIRRDGSTVVYQPYR